MSQAQPLNTSIKVYRTVRSYRQYNGNDSVASLTKRLRPEVLSVPGDEVYVEVKTRDSSLSDFSPYMGPAMKSGRGFPIVVGVKSSVSLADAQAGITGANFAKKIGQDHFIESTASGLTEDLHGEARSL